MDILAKRGLLDYLSVEEQLKRFELQKDFSVSSPQALALLVGLSYKKNPRKLFFLFPTIYEAEAFSQFLGDYIPEEDSFIFPFDEIFRTSAIGVSPEMKQERLLAISSLFSDKPSVLVAHASSFAMNILSKERYEKGLLSLNNGDLFLLKDVVNKLISLGYQSVDHVQKEGQFSQRGGILDIFDASYPHPVRIEFFGDEIDDLRYFHVEDELSFMKIDHILIHPASLRLLSAEEVNDGRAKIDQLLLNIGKKEDIDRLAFDDLLERMATLFIETKSEVLSDVDMRFYALFTGEDHSLGEYLSGYETYLFDESEFEETIKNAYKKEKEYFVKTIKNGASLPGEKVYSKNIDVSGFKRVNASDDRVFLVRDPSYKSISYSESFTMIQRYLTEGYKVRIVLPEPNLSNFINYLEENHVAYSKWPEHASLMLIEGKITKGFEIPSYRHVYLSAKEIFGISDQKSRFLSRYKEAKIIRKYEDLKVGDYVVHEVHGVGKYLGVALIDGLEYLKIQYADNALFYLPLAQYRLIRKYASREGYTPSLDKLGGSSWSRKKAKIRARISYLADQLLALYSERATRPGFAFKSERELEKEFIQHFAYPYTEGQLSAIDEVIKDMESPHPMDRLISGDVGFGKTEVAFFAAFKAVLSHKQVAMMAPTTILSNQHYKVALERFKPFGIKVCLFNRFVSPQKQKEQIEQIKAGEIDIIIGTHRLLSDEIVFKDLGLLIIDEEQKFGVAHKEKIKEKAKNIDCLTLTATPIPRTMQMSLLGVRAASVLSVPPSNRMPVKTYVVKQDNELIYEVIEKELNRRGQVYYLHNKISSIANVHARLQKKFKNYKIEYAHAQMSHEKIEEIMNRFYQGEIDVLICTTIVESGLDIPNVNTIIVENADRFGLSQLYQIKGRVGRSDRLAYAYFFFNDASNLTPEAQKRLKALKDFTELGSGYKIAMQDLNIRGAGDILGSEQAGFVDTLGYDAYMELLAAVVKEKKVVTEALTEKKDRIELSFSLDAHIPESYSNEEERINMYRELSDCENDDMLSAFSDKLRDVYGQYPEEVGNLLIKQKIENNLNSGLFSSLVEQFGSYQITMSPIFCSKPALYKKLDSALRPLAVKLRMKVNSEHLYQFTVTKTRDYLQDLLFLTQELVNAYYDGSCS